MKPLRNALLLLASLTLLALLIVPQARMLFKMQVLPDSAMKASLADCNTPQTEQFVRSRPNDYPVQLAAPFRDSQQTQAQYARRLVPRFPSNASLRANILRYATVGDVRLWRDEDYLLEGQPVPTVKLQSWEQHSTPAQLAAFDADAAAGERLDPDNAYFPFMRAIGLFEAHRDSEGLAAVERASRKPQWREYSEDETEGHWRIQQTIMGEREAVIATAAAASLMLPHYQRLRSVARVVTYKATLQEQAGHAEAGLALRREVASCGYLMTSHSRFLIGSLVGSAISNIARSHLSGARLQKSDTDFQSDKIKREQISHQRIETYVAYVRRLGHENAAQEALMQFQGEQKVQQLPFNENTSGEYILGLKKADFMRLLFSLFAGWAITANFLTTALLGLAAWGLSCLPHFRGSQSLPGGAGFRTGITLLLSLAGLFSLYNTRPEEGGDVISTLLFFTMVTFVVFSGFAVLRPAFRRPFVQGLLSGMGALAALLMFAALSAWKFQGATDMFNSVNCYILPGSGDPNHPRAMPPLLAETVGLFVPVMLMLVLSVFAVIRRVPVFVGLTRGLRAVTLPILCTLMILYGGLTLWTVRQEAKINYGLERVLHGEGQYLAELSGQAWPGVVR